MWCRGTCWAWIVLKCLWWRQGQNELDWWGLDCFVQMGLIILRVAVASCLHVNVNAQLVYVLQLPGNDHFCYQALGVSYYQMNYHRVDLVKASSRKLLVEQFAWCQHQSEYRQQLSKHHREDVNWQRWNGRGMMTAQQGQHPFSLESFIHYCCWRNLPGYYFVFVYHHKQAGAIVWRNMAWVLTSLPSSGIVTIQESGFDIDIVTDSWPVPPTNTMLLSWYCGLWPKSQTKLLYLEINLQDALTFFMSLSPFAILTT